MKKIFSLLTAALLIVACTPKEELGTPFQKGQKVTLAASMGGHGAKNLPGKHCVAGQDNGAQIDLTWSEGDQILVKVGAATATFTLESGVGSANGTFVGEMPAAGNAYSVVYPASYNESVLADQTYVENGFGNGLMKMSTKVAGTVDGGFSLSADNALLGLQLTGADALSQIVLTNPATSKTYTLNCTGVTLGNTVTLFYLVVPAGEWANGFTVSIKDGEGNEIASFAKTDAVTLSATEAMVMPAKEVEKPMQNYEGIGLFSVSATKQVTFSPGNLQYTQSTNTWSFASTQYEVLGTDNVTGGSLSSDATYGDSKSGTALADKIDLFGWSTSSTNFGVSVSTSSSDYSGLFVDWGSNKIGDDAPNTWRTLSYDEWYYLLRTRLNASSLCGLAQVNGVNGLIFLPDNWVCPEGVTFKPGLHSGGYGVDYYSQHQSFTVEQWKKMEVAGVVFLPAAGWRNGSDLGAVQFEGYYSSSTEYDNNSARYLFLNSIEASMSGGYRCGSHSVRLVKDVE